MRLAAGLSIAEEGRVRWQIVSASVGRIALYSFYSGSNMVYVCIGRVFGLDCYN